MHPFSFQIGIYVCYNNCISVPKGITCQEPLFLIRRDDENMPSMKHNWKWGYVTIASSLNRFVSWYMVTGICWELFFFLIPINAVGSVHMIMYEKLKVFALQHGAVWWTALSLDLMYYQLILRQNEMIASMVQLYVYKHY